MAKTPTSKPKSLKKAGPDAASEAPTIQLAARPDERRIRERAYCIWIEEGRPDGHELAHWRRASQELQGEAR
jgi:hypothetical protein